ncbi:class I SAM-dependent methyltransferase [Candidatus Woesebacteria bacterium]|nr:class I SAM-dependent methyltransferase [Candidatus Woesebacteria bacterium]
MKKTTDFVDLYKKYGEYNILFNQLNMASPSIEYSWRKTKTLIENKAILLLKERANGERKVAVCDIGCGNGATLIRLAQEFSNKASKISFTGFDISKPFVDFGIQAAQHKGLKNIAFKTFNIETDNLPSKYDVIICSEVLEHVHNPKEILKKIRKHIKKGGFLILSTPNSKNFIKYPFLFLKKYITNKNNEIVAKYLTKKEETFKLAEEEQHLYIFSHNELKQALMHVGFSKVFSLRGAVVFGGPFLDNHPLLFAATIVLDVFLDFMNIPQASWDTIFYAENEHDAF